MASNCLKLVNTLIHFGEYSNTLTKFALPSRKASVYPKNLGDPKLKTSEN